MVDNIEMLVDYREMLVDCMVMLADDKQAEVLELELLPVTDELTVRLLSPVDNSDSSVLNLANFFSLTFGCNDL